MKRKIFQEEHELFRSAFRKFVQTEIVPKYDKWEAAGCVPIELWLDAGKRGLLCPTAEKEYGGLEVDFLYSVIMTEELGFFCVSGFFLPLHNDVVFPYLNKLANKEQKQRWIPGCVTGENILALAMTEPDVGSDIAQLKTKATRESDFYIVNGSKTFISNGQLAKLFVVAVRTDEDRMPPHKRISLLVIEANSPGFSRGRNLAKIGLHAQDTSEIFFEDCRVPAENLLGEEGSGFEYLMDHLQQERLILAIGAAAAAEGALALTLDYVKNRRLFARFLSQFQNTRFELAEIATKIQLAQSFLDDLIIRHMGGERLIKEVSMAKYWISEMQFEVSDRCLQLFGGYGYMREYLISRHFVDSRVQRIYGGSNEVMKELIARELGL